jgi:hypothetical protein
MPVFERPKTLFGKFPYFAEQRKLFAAVDMLTRGIGAIDLTLVGIPIPTEWIPERLRKDRATRFLKRAKEMLVEVGVE